MIVLYILLGISLLALIYTYLIYPFTLRLFPLKSLKVDRAYTPRISLVVTAERDDIQKEDYLNMYPSDKIEFFVSHSIDDFFSIIRKASGEIIVVIAPSVTLNCNSIRRLVNTFVDKNVGCASGQVRRRPGPNGEHTEGLSWRYENKVKKLESGIGLLSGANAALYAIRKEVIPNDVNKRISPEFFLATHTVLKGFDCIYVEDAEAYGEEHEDQSSVFKKHVEEGSRQIYAICHFRRLLLPHKGSFVYISHRLMKWLVPFNMLILLLGSAFLSLDNTAARVFLALQLLIYVFVIIFRRRSIMENFILGKLTSVLCYFVELNFAWLLGAFKAPFKY